MKTANKNGKKASKKYRCSVGYSGKSRRGWKGREHTAEEAKMIRLSGAWDPDYASAGDIRALKRVAREVFAEEAFSDHVPDSMTVAHMEAFAHNVLEGDYPKATKALPRRVRDAIQSDDTEVRAWAGRWLITHLSETLMELHDGASTRELPLSARDRRAIEEAAEKKYETTYAENDLTRAWRASEYVHFERMSSAVSRYLWECGRVMNNCGYREVDKVAYEYLLRVKVGLD